MHRFAVDLSTRKQNFSETQKLVSVVEQFLERLLWGSTVRGEINVIETGCFVFRKIPWIWLSGILADLKLFAGSPKSVDALEGHLSIAVILSVIVQ